MNTRNSARPVHRSRPSGVVATLARPSTGSAPLRSLFNTKGGGRSQISDAPPSPQSSNFRVGPQLPFHVVTAGPEDDASGAAGLELRETIAQLLARACEGHLFGGGYVDERVVAVRNVEGMTAVNGQVADALVHIVALASHASPFGSAFTLSGSVVYLR